MLFRLALLILALTPLAPRAATFSLIDLGYPEGVTLQGPRAATELFFPLPAGGAAPGATLVLEMRFSPALDARSSITVRVGDEPLATIRSSDQPGPLPLRIPGRLLAGGYLRVVFEADQAMSRLDACFDNHTPSVWSRIMESTRLEVDDPPGPQGIAGMWRSLTGRVVIAVPANSGTAEAEAALVVAVALAQRGADPVIDAAAADPGIVIGPNPAALSVEVGRNGPVLHVANADAARALVAVGSVLRGIPMLGAARYVRLPPPAGGEAIPLAELGIAPGVVHFSGNARIGFDLPFDRLPAGRMPTGLVLFGAGTTLPPNEALLMTVLAGGRLVDSRAMRGPVLLDGLSVPLPADLVRHRMRIEIELQRVAQIRGCQGEGRLMFQLRPGSGLRVASGTGRVDRFESVHVAADRPALVRLDGPPAAVMPALPLAARLLADAGARPAAVEIGGQAAALDRPFIVIAETTPEGVQGAVVRPERARFVIEDTARAQRVELTGGEGVTLLQVVRGTGAAGIWISPGAPPTMLATRGISGGTVAVLDGRGPPILFDTSSPDVRVEQVQVGSFGALLSAWRVEALLAAWAVLTLIVVGIVVRLRRARG